MIRPAPAIEAIPAMTPFVGPEQLMRETGQRRSCVSARTKALSALRRKRSRRWRRSCRLIVVWRSGIVRSARSARGKARLRRGRDRRRLGHRRSDGIGRARLRAAGRTRADVARNVSHLQLSRDRLRRALRFRQYRTARTARRSRGAADARRARASVASSISPTPIIRADALSRATTSHGFFEALPARYAAAARRSVRRLRRRKAILLPMVRANA